MSQILSQFQSDLLAAFFNLPAADQFVLTGGTALAEYYLQHRLSLDSPASAPVTDVAAIWSRPGSHGYAASQTG